MAAAPVARHAAHSERRREVGHESGGGQATEQRGHQGAVAK